MNTNFTILFLLAAVMTSCGQKKSEDQPASPREKTFALQVVDTTKIDAFFADFPRYSMQKAEILNRYKADNSFIWFDRNGVIEFAGVLFNQANNMADEGLTVDVPYKDRIEQIIYSDKAPDQESELLLSCLYFFYTEKVFKGLDSSKSKLANWHLPRETKSYGALLDSLVKNPKLLVEGNPVFFSQYYNLRLSLKKYRELANAGGWKAIDLLPAKTFLKPGDTSAIVGQVRERLFAEGYLDNISGQNVYDQQLLQGITKYYQKQHRDTDSSIGNPLIAELNISIEERIKTIIVNMERCRWISPEISNAPEFIAVNIPSYRMHLIRKGKPNFTSKVVVGTALNKTVVFSGQLSFIVFSPYWNVPNSILEKEIKPAIRKNPNYLAKNKMEWHDGKVRQRPGPQNSLGLVKFLFPNSSNIYLHDTPAKSLFAKDDRAFSHGCIRVEKARELAVELMADDAHWTEQQVDEKMNAGHENWYRLKKPIPVYIGYFTAWADQKGNVTFYKDIYNRDERLLEMLHN